MKTVHIVKELERAAAQLGLPVRYETGNFRGGRCAVQGEDMIVLNERHPVEIHLTILAECLREQPVDTLFLRPAVRAALEAAWARKPPETSDFDVE